MSTPASGSSGPLGQPRGVAFVIILSIITFGIYSLYWVYKTQEEMKQHTGDGLGGVLGLVVWILISPVSAFVIPSEVGAMYKKAGQEPLPRVICDYIAGMTDPFIYQQYEKYCCT